MTPEQWEAIQDKLQAALKMKAGERAEFLAGSCQQPSGAAPTGIADRADAGHGFRARSQPGHHIAIIDFVRSHIDKKHAGMLTVFDRLCRKHNLALYDDTGFVSQHDVEQALQSAATT
jgi:hypothetical protein